MANKPTDVKSVAKSTTKKSKKGLAIGITVGALALAAAAVGGYFIWKNIQKPKAQSANLILDTKEGDYGDFSYDGIKPEGNEIDITKFIGQKEFAVYFIPDEEYKETDFTITIIGAEFGAAYEKEGDKHKVEFSGESELKNKAKLSATFTPEQPPVNYWTVTLDDDSTQYGTFENEETSIEIEQYIGETEATITFIPATGYEDTEFIVTAQDYTVNYTKGDEASIELTSDKAFAAGDEVELHFEEPTFTLTYHYQDGVSEDMIETYTATQETVPPTNPTRDDYIFGAWFTDEIQSSQGDLFIFGNHLTENTEVWAHWYKNITINYVNDLYTSNPSVMHFFNYLATDRKYHDFSIGSTEITIDDNSGILNFEFINGDESWPDDLFSCIEITVQNPGSSVPIEFGGQDYQFYWMSEVPDLNITAFGDNKIKTGATVTVHIKNPT